MLDDFGSMEEFLARYSMTVEDDEDIGLTLKEGDRLKPQACLKQDEEVIDAHIMRWRAEEYKGCRSLADGFYMLANQDDVLGEFPDFIYIMLSGTLLVGLDGKNYMAYLYVDGDRWNIMLLKFFREYLREDFFACTE